MFILLQNTYALVITVSAALLYSVLFLVVGSVLCRPSADLLELLAVQQSTKNELASIKLVQQDFVRHSRLNRKVIQLNKDVTAKKAKEAALHASYKSRLFYVKILLVVVMVMMFQFQPVLLCDSSLMWPLKSGGWSVGLHAWFLQGVAVTACEHATSSLLLTKFSNVR